jgi:hypothetical protein
MDSTPTRLDFGVAATLVTSIRVRVGTKRTSLLQCSPATSRNQGEGNGYRTAKHNQMYLKALNRLTVAGNPEQQGLDNKKRHTEPRHQARSRQERPVLEGEGKDLMVLEDLCGLRGLVSWLRPGGLWLVTITGTWVCGSALTIWSCRDLSVQFLKVWHIHRDEEAERQRGRKWEGTKKHQHGISQPSMAWLIVIWCQSLNRLGAISQISSTDSAESALSFPPYSAPKFLFDLGLITANTLPSVYKHNTTMPSKISVVSNVLMG